MTKILFHTILILCLMGFEKNVLGICSLFQIFNQKGFSEDLTLLMWFRINLFCKITLLPPLQNWAENITFSDGKFEARDTIQLLPPTKDESRH